MLSRKTTKIPRLSIGGSFFFFTPVRAFRFNDITIYTQWSHECTIIFSVKILPPNQTYQVMENFDFRSLNQAALFTIYLLRPITYKFEIKIIII